MKVLITGASGYIGSYLTQNLIADGISVIGIDWKTAPKNNYIHFQLDIRDKVHLQNIISDHTPDAIVHLAALRVPACDLSPRDAMEINHAGTINVVQAAQKHQVPKVIFASSCSVYGFPDKNAVLTETDAIEPVSAYSMSKAMAEDWIMQNPSEDTQCVCLRFATAYGVALGVRPDLMINSFVEQALDGQTVQIYQPEAWRPFCHVRDLAAACSTVLYQDDIRQGVYNVGSNSENYTKIAVWRQIQQHIPEAQMMVEPGVQDPRDYQIKFDKFHTECGFQTQYTIDTGIKELIDYYQKAQNIQ